MLVEEGFSVTSVDASDKMLKYALKERWDRRKEPAFDKWGMWVQPGPATRSQGHSPLCPEPFCAVWADWFSSGESAVPVIFLKSKALAAEEGSRY